MYLINVYYFNEGGKMKARIIERTIKDGNNQIIKYAIKGCETERVKVNSSGYYVFGDKSFSKEG